MQILAGDIGGTHTRLICADVSNGGHHILVEKSYSSADYGGLVQVIDVFLSEHNIMHPVDAACFAIAGPVESGAAKVTNLPWIITEKDLSVQLHTPRVKLINDFVAAAYGASDLQESDMLVLQQGSGVGKKSAHPEAVIIGAGTGFGASHRVWLNDHYQVFSSEAGHAGFAPENAEQNRLLGWLQKKYSHVSLEMLLSGKGLITIYQFLHEVGDFSEALTIQQAMRETDPAQVIAEHALLEDDDLCQKALDIFVDIYGAAASNVVLHYYPVTELYIAGGIAPKIKDRMSAPRFLKAFLNKGLMSVNMKKLTIKLVTQDKVGLYGALAYVRAFCI
ncbi:MAG: glucokinase [Gammaproteobacteria bacterium]|nr:glucokinase [Gammaproteobacteria bacterium]